MALRFQDFVPRMQAPAGFLQAAEFETFEEAVAAADRWIEQHRDSVELVSVETVVLPNIWATGEEGSQDTSLRTSGEWPASWHQFVRCWYREP